MEKSKWFDLTGRIRDVGSIYKKHRAMGQTRAIRNKFDIQIARKNIKSNLSLAETIIHELLHLWTEILVHLELMPDTKRDRHEIIYAIEHFASHVLKRKQNWKASESEEEQG